MRHIQLKNPSEHRFPTNLHQFTLTLRSDVYQMTEIFSKITTAADYVRIQTDRLRFDSSPF